MKVLTPRLVTRPWGGERLLELDSKAIPPIGEAYIHDGSAAPGLLIKWIDAKEVLSIQNHPSESGRSKRELWYFLEAPASEKIITGLKCGVTELSEKEKIEDWLEYTAVGRGDYVELPAGRVHSLTPGSLVLEIQEPLDVTYRIYDWGRGRELHLREAEKSISDEKAVVGTTPVASGVHSLTARPEFRVALINGPFEFQPMTTGVAACVAGPRKMETLQLDNDDVLRVAATARWIWCTKQ